MAKITFDWPTRYPHSQMIHQRPGYRLKTFDALDWLAQLVTHIPTKGEQMVRITDFTQTSRVDYAKKPAPIIKSRH